MASVKIHESEYGETALNFHVEKYDDELHVELTYPPYTDAENTKDQVRYVVFDQESVRASDGIRLSFDFERNGYVVQQPKEKLISLGGNSYTSEMEWIEVGFFEAWAFENYGPNGEYSAEQYAAADAELKAQPNPSKILK